MNPALTRPLRNRLALPSICTHNQIYKCHITSVMKAALPKASLAVSWYPE
jgi:hypothetical protein